MKHITRHIIAVVAFIAAVAAISPADAFALAPEHYAENSVLAEGKWRRVTVPSTGMHFLSKSQLSRMGFSDISKVNVYGTGGGMVPEGLTASMADDLPLLPVVRTASGIYFFGRDIFTWEAGSIDSDRRPFIHTINPYGTQSHYFVSDRSTGSSIPSVDRKSVSGLPEITDFSERIVHENDLSCPDETGRLMLGEDFRSQRQREFNFKLPDNLGASSVYVSFGAKVSNGSSSLILTANGQRLPVTSANNIAGVNGEQFIVKTDISNGLGVDSENLNLRLEYSYTGAIFTARLDYIEVFYKRALRINGGSLHFYLNPSTASAVRVAGASSDTEIWDVTLAREPRRVEFNLEGSDAVFRTERGYAEYVAVNPSQLSASGAALPFAAVENQNIHGMATPDMVIISPEEYLEGARRIAAVHEKADSMTVAVLTPEQIYNEFSGGTPDVSAFRKLLKMWYDRPRDGRIGYCLLMGRPSFDNKNVTTEQKSMGYNPLPIWQSPTGTTEVSSFSCDWYIAMLDDCEPGNLSLGSARQRVSVGRLPVTSAKEATQVAAKIEKYVLTPTLGPWRNRVMLIADDGDGSIHLRQSEDVYNNLRSRGKGNSFLYDRLYLDSYELEYTSLGACYPPAKERMMRNFNDGISFTSYIGHASPKTWSHEKLLMWQDVLSFSNPNPTLIYAATCSFGKWDAMDVSAAEVLTLNPTAGAIGVITPSRTVYMGQNGTLSRYIASNVYKPTADGSPRRWGDVCREGMNLYSDDNKLRYCMIGDPALRVITPERDIMITSIDGTALDGSADAPVLPAMGKPCIEGVVALPDGSVDTTFNGTINLQLFDAERVITTHGNNDAEVEVYNDHTTKLATASVKVEQGRWSARLMLPPEIDNVYSPALLSCYAWSDAGVEASGSTSQLYVYGMDQTETPDTEGPAIESFFLDTPSFAQGSLVGTSTTVFATVSDDSGINISESGIGHGMTLTLDGKTIYNDVYSFFTPDSGREGAGSIEYPIEGMEAGEHELEFTVWDNANNSSCSTLKFNVGANASPVITSLGTDVNPASTSVVFSVGLSSTERITGLELEVFDLSGRKVWSDSLASGAAGYFSSQWNLCDKSGARVPRGIYTYRATATTTDGTFHSKTKKLAVTAQ